MSLIKSEKEVINKCVYFFLPIYDLCYNDKNDFKESLINCYIDFDNYLYYVKIKKVNSLDIERTLHKLTSSIYFKNIFEDNETLTVELQIPTNYQLDVDKFKNGKYSLFSENLKRKLCSRYGRVSSRKQRNSKGEPVKLIFDVIYPTDEKMQDIADYLKVDFIEIKRVGEIYSLPNIEKESFKKEYGIKQ